MVLTGVVFVKMIGNWWTTCSFIVLLPLIYGPLYLACIVSAGLCLSKWLSCLLVGLDMLGDMGRHMFGVLFCSLLCRTYRENGTTESLMGRSVLSLSLSKFSSVFI